MKNKSKFDKHDWLIATICVAVCMVLAASFYFSMRGSIQKDDGEAKNAYRVTASAELVQLDDGNWYKHITEPERNEYQVKTVDGKELSLPVAETVLYRGDEDHCLETVELDYDGKTIRQYWLYVPEGANDNV